MSRKYIRIITFLCLIFFVLLAPSYKAYADYSFTAQIGSSGSGNGQLYFPQNIAISTSTGNIYVSDSGNKRVEIFNSSGVYQSQIASSTFGSIVSGVALDPAGNIYVSDEVNNHIDVFNSSGVFQRQFGSTGSGNGQFGFPLGIAVSTSTGNIYIADQTNNRIEVFNSSGVYQSQFGTLGSGNGQLNDPTYLTFDSGGNLYVSDNANARIEVFSSGGTYEWQFGTAGSGNGQFSNPSGLAIDPYHNIYIVDTDNSRVEEFSITPPTVSTSPATAVSVSTLTLNGVITATGTGGNIIQSGFAYGVVPNLSTVIATTTLGGQTGAVSFSQTLSGLYPATTYYYRAYATNMASTSMGAILSTTTPPIYSYTNAFGSSGSGNGQFNLPEGVATDQAGNIYVADDENNRVDIFNPAGVYISKFGTLGVGNGNFEDPFALSIASSTGNIYVVDQNNNRIEIFNPTGAYLSQFGSFGAGNGQFNGVYGVAVSQSNGYVYAADTNERVEVFDPSGVFQSKFGSFGVGNGQFNGPYFIAVATSTGNIYVTDIGNDRVEVFNSSGVYQFQFGSSGSSGGEFNFPTGIALDSAGNVYVVDHDNHRIEVFDPSGNFLYTFGWGVLDGASSFETCSALSSCQSGVYGSGNGQFFFPESIAIDQSGNIYVSDINNDRVEEFSLAGALPTVTTPSASSVSATTATANGVLSLAIGLPPTTEGFVYGTSISYGSSVSSSGNFGLGSFSTSLVGLACNTVYHVAAYAINAKGTSYGNDQTFKTGVCPTQTVVSNGPPVGLDSSFSYVNPNANWFAQGSSGSSVQASSTASSAMSTAVSASASSTMTSTAIVYNASSTITSSRQSSGLSSAQVSAIILLLRSFNADPSVVADIGQELSSATSTMDDISTSSSIVSSVSTPSSTFIFDRNLGFGDTGEDVHALQVYLNGHGYPISSSGPGSSGNETMVFGRATEAALAKLQAKNGIIPAGGYFGSETMAWVNSHV